MENMTDVGVVDFETEKVLDVQIILHVGFGIYHPTPPSLSRDGLMSSVTRRQCTHPQDVYEVDESWRTVNPRDIDLVKEEKERTSYFVYGFESDN